MIPLSYRKYFIVLIVFFTYSNKIFPQDSTLTVTAKKGEGIYALLRSQGIHPYKYFDDFVALNIENLRDSVHLYEGRSYVLPAVKRIDSIAETTNKKKEIKTVSHEIFGNEFKETEIKSARLSGNIYYLISGHGGPDPGTVTNYNKKLIAEDEYAYDVTLRLAKELIGHGATVYMIVRDADDGIRNKRILKPDNDEVLYPEQIIPLNQIKRLKQRTETVNELYLKHSGKYRRLIVTHVDSRSKGQNIDVFFYHHKKSKGGKKLAESIHQTFGKKYKKYQPNRAYTGTFSERNLYLVNKTYAPMAYIEIGNIKSKKDQRRILYPINRQALAEWIAEGVLLDFEGGSD